MAIREGSRKTDRMAIPTRLWLAGNHYAAAFFRANEETVRGYPYPGSRRELPSVGRMPERRQVRESAGQDGRSERPATGYG